MADQDLPSPETLRNLLNYDPDTGALTWKERPVEMFEDGAYSAERRANRWNATYAGKPAFTHIDDNAYHVGGIHGRLYKAHRVAWAIYYGEWPRDQVDHRNGIRTDNRIKNLRAVVNMQNARNQKLRSTNTSGRLGVRRRSDSGRWGAWINDDTGKRCSLGVFDSFEEACAARSAAERRYGYSKRHGAAE